jgi:hypothetical protein
MPAMQPHSGGPYSDQKYLRWEINQVKQDLAAKPMGPRTRKGVEKWLVELQGRLKKLNAEIREMKKSRAKSML